MSTDFRALCAELHTAVQLYTGQNPAAAETPANELVARLMAALAATAAALAQPEPEGVTDEEKWYPGFADWLEREMPEGTVIGDPLWWASKIADYLQRFAHPTIEPVPVAERPWEREKGWNDPDGECWWCPPDGPPYWQMANPAMVYGGWLLPHHALPLPTP